jgi:hypothetical protein
MALSFPRNQLFLSILSCDDRIPLIMRFSINSSAYATFQEFPVVSFPVRA